MFIIWGSTGKKSVQDTGSFFCPQCSETRPYSHVIVKRWFTLYFLPVFPMETAGEYVECGGCAVTFKPEVLSYDPEAERIRLIDELNDNIMRVMVLIAVRDGRLGTAESKVISETYQAERGRAIGAAELETEARLATTAGVTAAAYAGRIQAGLSAAGKEKVLRAAILACQADGALTPEEKDRLTALAAALDITPTHLNAMLTTSALPEPPPVRRFGLSPAPLARAALNTPGEAAGRLPEHP
jgi:tellurite resistance protein